MESLKLCRSNEPKGFVLALFPWQSIKHGLVLLKNILSVENGKNKNVISDFFKRCEETKAE